MSCCARKGCPPQTRQPTKRSILMCRPTFFTVAYAINPYMNTDTPVDQAKAVAQWQTLYDTYEQLGFDLHLIDPLPGLPDMVFAANGGFVLDGIAYGAKFRHPERQPEGPAYMNWFRNFGLKVVEPEFTNEGMGDFTLVGNVILAGTGFRADVRSHEELRRVFKREVVTLKLVNPRYYHLDVALTVLDPVPVDPSSPCVAYLESAFDEASLATLRNRFPNAIIASEEDAALLALNSYSDGYNVVYPSKATNFARQLKEHGYNPIGVDLSELFLGGGSIRCCTLDLHPVGTGTSVARAS
nr:PREDICTED: uncharacterized protein ZK1307.1-like [Bemisia tabaci]XP_018918227.1 PREDICTED: uncharacterized protein ZK1307.1-like [Bemisia tabaci]